MVMLLLLAWAVRKGVLSGVAASSSHPKSRESRPRPSTDSLGDSTRPGLGSCHDPRVVGAGV